jgi:hypothetical protein
MIGLSYNAIVDQIVAQSGSTFNYVAYSATPQQINWLAANPTYPAAFVSPGPKDTEPNIVSTFGDIRQWVTENFTVCVLFSNAGDMLAQDSADQVPLYRETLRKALTNWHPLPSTRTTQPVVEGDDDLFLYEGGARTAWLFHFSQRYQIATEDCYTPTPTPPPITIITTDTGRP